MQFSHIIEQSPCNWETTMRWNVVLTIVHTQNIYHPVWKTIRTTLQSNVGFQSQRESHEMEKNCATNLSHYFPCFSNHLHGIGEQWNIKVWFWEFSTHDDIYFVFEKLSELHNIISLSASSQCILTYFIIKIFCGTVHLTLLLIIRKHIIDM